MADSTTFAYLYMNPANRSDRLFVRDLKVRMAPFHHDLATIIIQGRQDMDWTQWNTGTPLRVTYGRFPGQVGTFYGYVLSTSRHWKQTEKLNVNDRTMEVLAIGASWPLKEGLSTTFNGMTSSQIATQIAGSYYFDVDSPPTSYVWAAKNVSGMTTWAFLCGLARESGLVCAMTGTQLRFYDPMTVLRRGASPVPTFYEKDSAASIQQGPTVLDMVSDNTEVSAMAGRRKMNRVVRGLDISTGATIYSSDNGTTSLAPFMAGRYQVPFFDEYVPDLVTTSQVAATALLPARTVENRFYIRAKATLAGDPNVVQETPIVLEGLGPRDSGIWQVIEVTHHFRKNWYSLECELGRDSDYDTGARPAVPAGVARPRYDPHATVVFNNPNTTLSNGLWRAQFTSQQVPGAA